jgi:hypothetical protein
MREGPRSSRAGETPAVKVRVSFGSRALVGANDGLDPSACAARYAEALSAALSREWPGADIEVAFTDDRAATRAEAGDPAVERTALDLAWVIKGCSDWSR